VQVDDWDKSVSIGGDATSRRSTSSLGPNMTVWLALVLVTAFVVAVVFAMAHVAGPKAPVPSKLLAPCPVCSGKEIYLTGKVYECANYHSVLRVAITSRSLWAIPTLVGMCAVILLTVPLQRSGILSGMWLAASRGGLAALAFGVSARVFIRGLKYRVPS
jgi:predicted neutral ceramidase superfamily lipid hydrolase